MRWHILKLVFRLHAVQRMAERRFGVADVRHVLATGLTVETYPHDLPYPSRLVLGWINDRPVHVVVADLPPGGETVIITVCEPDLDRWWPGFKRRRQ